MQFPTLSTGSITQYGSAAAYVWPAQVIRFLDGSDQRFLACGRALRRWAIDFRLLNESEIAALEAFFRGVEGEYSPFTFPDPITGVDIPNCRVGSPQLITEYHDVDIAETSIWVVETNG